MEHGHTNIYNDTVKISKNEVITHHGDWFEGIMSPKNPHGIMTMHRILTTTLMFFSFLNK